MGTTLVINARLYKWQQGGLSSRESRIKAYKRDKKGHLYLQVQYDNNCPDCDGTGWGTCPCCGGTTDCRTCGGTGFAVDYAWVRSRDFWAGKFEGVPDPNRNTQDVDTQLSYLFDRYGTTSPASIRDYWVSKGMD